ncbi:MAG TPA: hypothetical protein VK919_00630 [Solirubrobacterales bacterium]|nr:hypothetical protein [Solirubrobacterales bacterium]
MTNHHSRGRRLGLLVAAGTAIALGIAAIAWAAPVQIPDSYDTLNLNSVGQTAFDVSQPPDSYNDDCALGDLGGPTSDDVGYTPATDVKSADGDTDTFDGGLVLAVARPGGGAPVVFEDRDGFANKVGEQVTAGPTKLLGLSVTRTERAFAKTPTLRSLIKLRNPKRKNVRRKLIWDSDLGADGSEVLVATSTNDLVLTGADRWMIFDESDGSDPLGTFVLYGKGKGVKRTRVFDPVADADGCISFEITVKVPKRSTRYLLFFTQAHDSDAPVAAVNNARKFDRRKPKGVLGGLSKAVKKRIVNWDLAR